jgi:hypothetical protein
MKPLLYKLKTIERKQLILQAPSGGLRIVHRDGSTTQRTALGYVLTTPYGSYAISAEDHAQLRTFLKDSA